MSTATLTEHLTSREYSPTDRLLDLLTEFLTERLREEMFDPAGLARLFLTWAHDRPDLDRESRTAEPLTDEAIVARIRLLVGVPDPDQTGEINALGDEITALTGEVAALRAERDAAVSRLEHVERDLKALSDIIDGIRG